MFPNVENFFRDQMCAYYCLSAFDWHSLGFGTVYVDWQHMRVDYYTLWVCNNVLM